MMKKCWLIPLFCLLFGFHYANHYQSRQLSLLKAREQISGQELHCGVTHGRGLTNYLRYGMHYDYLKEFGRTHRCQVSVHPVKDTVAFYDSLLSGTYDIIILPVEAATAHNGVRLHYNPDSSIVWATTARKPGQALVYDNWLAYASSENPDLALMKDLFNDFPNRPGGTKRKYISPYDKLIRKYAPVCGWDWRLVAALIYKESRFAAAAVSPKGAIGMMQLMPSSVEKFEPGDLFDPEENLRVGTLYLDTLIDRLDEENLSPEEQTKFVLASYNAGFYRIEEAREIAAREGLDPNVWDEVFKAFEFMPGFDGISTSTYVQRVLETYENYLQIHPGR